MNIFLPRDAGLVNPAEQLWFCTAASCSSGKLFLPDSVLIHSAPTAERESNLWRNCRMISQQIEALITKNGKEKGGNGRRFCASLVHQAGIWGCPASPSRTAGTTYPPARDMARGHGFVCVLIAVFLAGHADILKTVSYEEKISSWLSFPSPAHPSLNLSNLCAKHHSLTDICKHKFSEENRKSFENCNPNPFFFSIISALIMTVLSSIFIYG